jgi:uridine kinase
LYDFAKGSLSGDVITIPRDATVIVEDVWSLQEAFVGFYDYRIWLEAPADVRLERGVARDGEDLRQVWEEEWIPIDEHYREAHQPHLQTDCVIDSFHLDFSEDKIVVG